MHVRFAIAYKILYFATNCMCIICMVEKMAIIFLNNGNSLIYM